MHKILKSTFFATALVLVCNFSRVEALVAKAANPPSLLASKRVLIIKGTETSGDHYNARLALNTRFLQMRTLYGFTLDSANGSSPPSTFAQLDPYDIIVFNYWFNSSQAATLTNFQNAFRTWANSTSKRRGWVGMHTSGANELNEWNWMRDSLTSMLYFVHSTAAQTGKIGRTTDAAILSQPIMQGLVDSFQVPSDEWYEFTYGPTWSDVKVMYYLNERSLPTQLANPMNPHPSTWYRENPITHNRFFYTALVHNSSGVTSTSGNEFFPSLMLRALEYVAGYDTTAVSINGNGLYKNGKSCLCLMKGELKVDFQEPFQIEVRSLQGKLLFSGRGKGEQTFRPEAIQKSGLYVVKVAGKSAAFTQRVLVQ